MSGVLSVDLPTLHFSPSAQKTSLLTQEPYSIPCVGFTQTFPFTSRYASELMACLDPVEEPFPLIEVGQLAIPDWEEMAERYNITEFNTAIKPFVFMHLFDQYQHGTVVYLDPDILVMSRMIEMESALREGAEAVMTPHILEPAENVEISDVKMLQSGIYNLGLIGLRNTARVRNIASWWGRRMERECVINLEQGLFVDQKWADLFPAFIHQTPAIMWLIGT